MDINITRRREDTKVITLNEGTQSLTFTQLTAANVARCEEVFHPLNDWSPTDWACALAGEVGEAIEALMVGDVEAIGLELADVVIYANLLKARLEVGHGGFESFHELKQVVDRRWIAAGQLGSTELAREVTAARGGRKLAMQSGLLCNTVKKLRRGEDVSPDLIESQVFQVLEAAQEVALAHEINLERMVRRKFNLVSVKKGSTVFLPERGEGCSPSKEEAPHPVPLPPGRGDGLESGHADRGMVLHSSLEKADGEQNEKERRDA